MVKKIVKALEFNILLLNNINYVSVLPSNEVREKKKRIIMLHFMIKQKHH